MFLHKLSKIDICKIIKLYAYSLLYYIAKNNNKLSDILDNTDITPNTITSTIINTITWSDIKNNLKSISEKLSNSINDNELNVYTTLQRITSLLEKKFTIKQLYENINILDTYFQKNDNIPHASKTYMDSHLILNIIINSIYKSSIHESLYKYVKQNHFIYENTIKSTHVIISKDNIIFILGIILFLIVIGFLLYILYTKDLLIKKISKLNVDIN